MFQSIRQNKFLLFLVKAGLLYTGFYLVYEFVLKKATLLDERFIRFIINLCIGIFNVLGFKTFASREVDDMQVFGIDGSNGVWIGGPCNGITLMCLFAVFVMAYPGNWKQKAWYIPLGIVLVFLINIIRIVALALIAYYTPQYLSFNHTYTFTFLAYSFVFMLWMIWVNKFSSTQSPA